MGNQHKKDAKREKRKKLQARDNQIRNEQQAHVRKEMIHSLSHDSIFDLIRRYVRDGRATPETQLYLRLKNERTFTELQERILMQIQLQANDPRPNHSIRAIPPRVYICKDASAVATLYVSPLVRFKCKTTPEKVAQGFYEVYAQQHEVLFVCFVFGVTSAPSAEHFAVLAGPAQEMEVFLVSAGKWIRLGHGAMPAELMVSMSKLLMRRGMEAPEEDPVDHTVTDIAGHRFKEGEDPVEVYLRAAQDVVEAAEPLGGQLLSRIEDWVTQQHRTIQRLHNTVSDLTADLEESKRSEREFDKQLKRANLDLASAKASLSARLQRSAGDTAVSTRPLKDRMAEIFM